jgi:uncharacterized repeat protein (TIGR01451 family)
MSYHYVFKRARIVFVSLLFAAFGMQSARAQNQAPVITGPSAITLNEDASFTFSTTNRIAITDPDVAASNMTCTIVVTNGNLTLSTVVGLSITNGANGQSRISFVGTLTRITNALDGVQYTPSNNFFGTDTFQLDINDLGHNGAGGPLADTHQVVLAVSGQNDAPTLTTPGSFNAIEGLATNLSGVLAISVADIDVGLSNLNLGLSATNGTITFGSTAGLVLQQGANGSTGVTYQGTLASLNAALLTLSYSAISNANDIDNLRVVANDLGNTGSGGSLFDTNFVTISITGQNDPPSANLPAGPFNFNEDTTNVIGGISVSDPDAFGSNLVVNIWATNGRVNLATTAGLTFTNGANNTGRFAIRGNRTNLNNALNNLTYAGGLNTNQNNITGAEQFTLTVNDLGHNGAGGAFEATNSFLINIAAINDRPTIIGPVLVTTNEDAQAFVGQTVNDVDGPEVPGYEIDVTLIPTNGRLFLSNTNGLTFLVGSIQITNSTNFVIRGNITNVNNAISGLIYLPSPNFNGTGGVTVTANDQGQSGAGGILTTTRFVSVVVTPVNDGPILGLPATNVINQNTNTAMDLTGAFADRDVNEAGTGATITVSITSTNGLFSLAATNGLNITSGQATFSTQITFQATLSNANTAIALTSFLSPTNFVGQGSLGFSMSDEGNTGAGGAKTTSDVVYIDILDVNVAPELDNTGTMSFTGINEDTTNTGDTVSALIASAGGDRITDADPGDPEGIAVIAADITDGMWQWSTNGGTTFNNFNTVSEGEAILLASTARIRFVPALDFNGVVEMSFRAWDQDFGFNGQTNVDAGIGGGDSAFSTNIESATITIAPVNDAPAQDNAGDMALTPIVEEDFNSAGDSISNIFTSAGGDRVTDPDSNAVEGVAVVFRDNSNGTWQYALTGTNWINFGAVADASATLLPDDALVRFVPVSNFFGNVEIRFRAWDRTSGTNGQFGVNASVNGAATAFSSAIETGVVVVTDANEAPLLDSSGAMTLTPILENNFNNGGDTVANIIASAGGDRITDLDAGALEGIVIVGADNTNGTWQFSTDGGTLWNNVGSAADDNAVLVADADLVRFSPNVGFDGTATILFRAWDQTSGASGDVSVDVTVNGDPTAFSTNTETATITVTPDNVAPVIDNTGNMTLTPIAQGETNSPGNSVDDIITSAGGDRITDGDVGAVEGFAVIAADTSNGSWQFSTDSGFSWNSVGAVADSSARLLNQSSLLRFIPTGAYSGPATITFRAWDQTSGANGQGGADASVNGGLTAFSTGIETAQVDVVPANAAPVLDNTGAMTLSAILENTFGSAGDTVSNIIASAGGDRITDADPGAVEGIGVLRVEQAFGTWQYQTSGTNWVGFGSVSNQAAVLLNPDARIRFVPIPNFDGTASIVFRAWDQTSGANGDAGVDMSNNGDPTAFSVGIETAAITVIPDNVAPVLDNTGSMALPVIFKDDTNSAGATVAGIIASAGGDRITDADTNAVEGVAVTAVDDANGEWQYSLNNGGTWSAFGAVADAAAVQLDNSARVRFVPDLGFTGVVAMTLRAWDQTDIFGIGATGVNVSVNGGATAYSAASETVTVSVVELTVNIAPVLDNTGDMSLPSIFEDAFTNAGEVVSNIIASAGGDRITDSNPGAVEGIAVVGVVTSNGNWQFSIDGGATWNNFFNVSDTAAVVLDDAARIRFLPNGNFSGNSGPFTFRAWDRSDTHVSGDTGVAVTNNGGMSPFSIDTETADLVVVPMSDLNISKEVVGALVPGTVAVYRITVTNIGPTHATNVVVTDILPPQGSPSGTLVTNIGNLFEGQSRSFFVRISLGPDLRGALTNRASVVHGGLDDDLTDNGVTNVSPLVPSADLAISKSASPTPAQEGRTLTYTLTVTNRGPSTALGVVVTDALPAYVSFQSASAGASHAGGMVTRPFGTVAAGTKATMTITVVVSNGAFGAVLTNTAWVASNDPDAQTNNNVAALAIAVVSGDSQNDFDGDGVSDVGVVQPSTFVWTVLRSGAGTLTQQFGFGTCVPVPGDYDGDGKWDLAVYDPVANTWYILPSSGGFLSQQFGFAGITPVPADYDADGKTDIAVYHAASGFWYIQQTADGFKQQQFGFATGQAVPADYDGDGRVDLAIYDGATATWYLMRSTAGFLSQQFGFGSVTPVPADYDGDGWADVGVYDQANGMWYVLRSNAGFAQQHFGFAGTMPLPADYDGDKSADYGVYDPASGTWYLLQTAAGFESFTLGTAGSIPFTTIP